MKMTPRLSRSVLLCLAGMALSLAAACAPSAQMSKKAPGPKAVTLIPEDKVRHNYFIDLRYVKQYHEVSVQISREELEQADPTVLASRFHPENNRLYGYSLENERTKVELINMRLTSLGLTEKPRLPEEKFQGEDSSHALKRKRRMWLPVEKRFEQVPVYDGHKLKFGNRLQGPALNEQVNTSRAFHRRRSARQRSQHR